MSPRGLALLLLLLVVAESSALRVPTRLVPPPRARPTVCLAGEPDDATLERGRAALEKMRQSAGVGFAAEPEAPPAVEPARASEPTSGPFSAAPGPAGGINLAAAGAALIGGGVLALIAGTVLGGNPFEGAAEAPVDGADSNAAEVAALAPRDDS